MKTKSNLSRRDSPSPATMEVSGWLSRARDKHRRGRIEDDRYSLVYPFLREHFSSLRKITWGDAVVGLHIVYGWMPTIPRLEDLMDWDGAEQSQLLEILRAVRLKKVTLGRDEIEIVRRFANHSMVGASKLLHFLEPTKNPIWDIKVARAFLLNSKITHAKTNKIESWIMYRDTLRSWLANPEVQKVFLEIRGLRPELRKVSDLRILELVLYH